MQFVHNLSMICAKSPAVCCLKAASWPCLLKVVNHGPVALKHNEQLTTARRGALLDICIIGQTWYQLPWWWQQLVVLKGLWLKDLCTVEHVNQVLICTGVMLLHSLCLAAELAA